LSEEKSMLGNFVATLSGAVNLALDAGIPDTVLAKELMRFARMLQPAPQERLSIDGPPVAKPRRGRGRPPNGSVAPSSPMPPTPDPDESK
jgi:hypothetical protein